MRTLKIKLIFNAHAVVQKAFTIKPPIGDEIKFEKGGVLTGQHDGGDNPFWIQAGEWVAPIKVTEPIIIEAIDPK